MDVLKTFKELDLLVRPSGLEDAATIKAFKLNVEQFLQTAKPQVSWSSVFHERMLQTHSILSLEQYNQYVDTMKYFIELNSTGNITKMQQVCVTLANNLLDFLLVHKMDTDSALIGLSPSNNIYDSCIEPERHLPHQVVGWRTLETSAIKTEVRKMADKVAEWINISKGDLLIIRKSRGENGLVYARYSGEKSKTTGMGSSMSVWVDIL